MTRLQCLPWPQNEFELVAWPSTASCADDQVQTASVLFTKTVDSFTCGRRLFTVSRRTPTGPAPGGARPGDGRVTLRGDSTSVDLRETNNVLSEAAMSMGSLVDKPLRGRVARAGASIVLDRTNCSFSLLWLWTSGFPLLSLWTSGSTRLCLCDWKQTQDHVYTSSKTVTRLYEAQLCGLPNPHMQQWPRYMVKVGMSLCMDFRI